MNEFDRKKRPLGHFGASYQPLHEKEEIKTQVRLETVQERVGRQRRERRAELTVTAEDTRRWFEHRKSVVAKRREKTQQGCVTSVKKVDLGLLRSVGLSGKGAMKAAQSLASPLDESLRLINKTRVTFFSDLPAGPNREYHRGDVYPLDLPDTFSDLDARLSAIIQHTSRTCGSAGQVQSFTSSLAVARRFARTRNTNVQTVDASSGMFMSAGEILYLHGDRLVKSGKIKGGTLRAAVQKFYECQECEYFWMGKY